MADPRNVADRLTSAVISEQIEAVTSCYGADALLVAPEGTYKGRDAIWAFFREWFDAFPELSFDVGTKAAWGNQALDEWSLTCTSSGPLAMPTGETVAPTGGRVTVRGADVCTVEGDVVVEHHLYYDQVELLGQLGLLTDSHR